MAAAMLCGHKRSFFEDPESPYGISKRFKHYSPSPLFAPPAVDHQQLDQISLAQPVNDTAADVESFVKEMTCATSLDDARSRASRLLEVFQRSITEKVSVDFGKENAELKEKIEGMNTVLKRAAVIHDDRQKEVEDTKRENAELKEKIERMNTILKRAAVIHDERQKEAADTKRELQDTKEQLRQLKVENYALKMHLSQAQHNTSIPGQFHPHVY